MKLLTQALLLTSCLLVVLVVSPESLLKVVRKIRLWVEEKLIEGGEPPENFWP